MNKSKSFLIILMLLLHLQSYSQKSYVIEPFTIRLNSESQKLKKFTIINDQPYLMVLTDFWNIQHIIFNDTIKWLTFDTTKQLSSPTNPHKTDVIVRTNTGGLDGWLHLNSGFVLKPGDSLQLDLYESTTIPPYKSKQPPPPWKGKNWQDYVTYQTGLAFGYYTASQSVVDTLYKNIQVAIDKATDKVKIQYLATDKARAEIRDMIHAELLFFLDSLKNSSAIDLDLPR